MRAFVDRDNDMVSGRMLKKILFVINILLKIKDKTLEIRRPFEIPSLNALLRYQENKIPVFPSKLISIPMNDGESQTVGLNLPSEHLKLLMSNPKKTRLIASV